MSIRKKAFMITQQLDYYDTDDIKVIYNRLLSLSNVKKCAVIIHDRDTREDGELKKPHFHAVITFSDATSSQTVANRLLVEEQYVEKIKTTTTSSFLYLIHKNDLDKFPYSPKDVLANFDYVDFADDYSPKQKREDIANRIMSGEIKQYNLLEYITIDEYAKNLSYYNNCFKWRQNKMKTADRQLQCVYITWPSWTWKTTFAKTMASDKWYKSFVSSGGKKPLDDYQWEECIILDDIRDDTYTLADFLKLTDNHTDSLVGCRFYNKSISECKLIIITSVVPIEDFYRYQTWTWDGEESQVQLFRRIPTYIKMSDEYIRFLEYDRINNKYIERFHIINPVSIMYNPKINNAFIAWLKETFKSQILTDEDNHDGEAPLFSK